MGHARSGDNPRRAQGVGAALPPDVLAALRTAVERIFSAEPCVRVVIFGSRASGTGTERSDIDIGVDAGHTLAPELMVRLRDALDALPILQKTDVVDLATVTSEFRRIALAKVVVLLERQAA